MTHIACYWWKGSPERPVDNWGDRLNGMIPVWLGTQVAWRPPEDAELVVLGSVLEHLPARWTGTVCGAGKLHPDSRVDLSYARVLALRGRLTRDSVTGLRTEPVLGDPALLLPHWVPQWPAKYDLGVVPHWSDPDLAKRYPYGHLIDPRARPEEVVAQIVKCKRIISSSLHGIIVADAYGIPRQAERFPRAHLEGGDFKYRDYMSIFYAENEEIDVHFGQMWRAPQHIVERVQNQLAMVLSFAVGTGPPPDPVPAPPDLYDAHPNPQISLLVPFRHDQHDAERREHTWNWLNRFWKHHLDSAEIIVGHDQGWPFSKSSAINYAAERARGRVFVVIDADAYLDPAVLQRCADDIEAAVAAGQRRWFMPYRRLYRLNESISHHILAGDPTAPYAMPSPPPPSWREKAISENSCDYGHRYGALCQIMPREAFFEVNGMDPRFRGWGSEDAALLRSLDTLYCQHEVTTNDIVHLFHLRPGKDWKTRRWVGQTAQANNRLAQRYAQATGEPGFMAALTREHPAPVSFASHPSHPRKPYPWMGKWKLRKTS